MPDPTPTVAVLVPSYNHGKFIEATLRSIFAQKYRPSKILVIDDGSRDDSVVLVERLLSDSPVPAELIARENRGLSATLNEGLERLPNTDYFAYIGSDDIWLPGFLENRVNTLQARQEAVLAYGHGYSIDADNNIIDCSSEWASYTDGDVRKMLLSTIAPLSPTVVYRRSALEGRRWNEASRLEDYEMYLQLSVVGDFAFDAQILSAWRQHSYNSILDLDMMLSERLKALERTAPELGLTTGELTNYQRLARFRTAQDMMRQGRRLAAARIGLTAITAARSPVEAIRFVVGLAAPHSFIRRKQERVRASATAKYGTIIPWRVEPSTAAADNLIINR